MSTHKGHCIYFEWAPCARAILLSKPEGHKGLWGVEIRKSVNSLEWFYPKWFCRGTLDEVETLISQNLGD